MLTFFRVEEGTLHYLFRVRSSHRRFSLQDTKDAWTGDTHLLREHQTFCCYFDRSIRRTVVELWMQML
uniref:RRM domain-containing protein n=1 Tax=Parascaris univalens TaxID=6257 RepID=A0A915A818_PARUN